MAKFHRSRLDRVEQRLRPAVPRHHNLSKLHDLLVTFGDKKGDERKTAERAMNDEMRKIFGISEIYSGEVIIQAFLELGRKG